MVLTDYLDVTIFTEPIYAAILAFMITLIAKYVDDCYIIKTKCKLVRHLKTCIYVGVLVGLFVYLCKYGLMVGSGNAVGKTLGEIPEFDVQLGGGGEFYVGSTGEQMYVDLNSL